MINLGVFKCHGEAVLPSYGTSMSACFDITLAFDEGKLYTPFEDQEPKIITGSRIAIPPKCRLMVGTGLIFDIPKGYQLKIHVRSSTGIKKGLTLANGVGIIDADYINELKACFINNTDRIRHVSTGNRLIQGELQKVENFNIMPMDIPPRPKSERTGGVGSTDGDPHD